MSRNAPLVLPWCRQGDGIRPPCRRLAVTALLALFLLPQLAEAMPAFARKYSMSCAACHAAFPRLNEFGHLFVDGNYRLPDWKDTGTRPTGDDLLALPESVPLALRAQSYVQVREASAIDVRTGSETSADLDFQAPYLIKLLSSAPLSDHVTYYFYGIFAEKGGNGETVIEDAWFSHDDLFGSGVGLMLGQFQVSDLMFPRETRLTFQDFMAYRMAKITYERGVLFSGELGPLGVDIGAVNGNGISDNYTINSPGYKRPDHLFDNDGDKSLFGRIGGELGGVSVGLFGYRGSQPNATGDAGMESGARDTDKRVVGIDLSFKTGANTWWFAQGLWNRWDGFLDPDRSYDWFGGFAGVDWVRNDHWTLSALWNYADAGDLEGSDTIYEGIAINTVTLAASYYFMRNVKAVVELNVDLQDTVEQSGQWYTGHLSGENYLLVGFDAAF